MTIVPNVIGAFENAKDTKKSPGDLKRLAVT